MSAAWTRAGAVLTLVNVRVWNNQVREEAGRMFPVTLAHASLSSGGPLLRAPSSPLCPQRDFPNAN